MTERVRPAGDGRASGATRVTHVLGYYPPHIGGMEQRVQELCSALSARGHDVSIATSDIGGMTRGRERVDGVAINRYHGWDVGVTPFVPFMLLGLLRAPKPDLYHIHIAHAGITEIGYLVARLRRRPYIVQVRMSPRPSTRFGVLLPLYRTHSVR
jgi:glycosyltransferase involved in cell wall biosynthesis